MILKFFTLFILWMIPSLLQGSDIYIQIQRGESVTIGIPQFLSKSSSDSEITLKETLEEVVLSDILFSQILSVTQEGPTLQSKKIDFSAWKNIGADLLLQGVVHLKEDKRKVEKSKCEFIASLYETSTTQPIFQKLYRSHPQNVRRIAHEFVSDLLFRLTGDPGVAKSRIAFSNDSSGRKEIYVADYDGQNHKQVTFDKKIALLPNWSPDGSEIIYTTYRKNNPDLYIFSLENGVSRPFSKRQGLNSAACFSPDGSEITATLSFEGFPNLYLLDREGKILKRITNGKFADTSATFSPDGRKILFVSDRAGTPQIYIMDKDGTNVTRLTESGYCDSPTWSPKGDKIAYSQGTEEGKHNIIVQSLATGERLKLTEWVGNNENPSFSPDGRFIVFSSDRNGKRELFVASLDGRVHRKLCDIPGNSITPDWSSQ